MPTSRTGAALLLSAIIVVLLALCAIHRYLPMNDAPSHIANAVIINGLWRGDPFFSAHYDVLAIPLPYWMAALAQIALRPLVADPLVAYRVLVAVYLLLVPLSFYRLRRASPETGADRSDALLLTPLAALMGLNWAYYLGEINFLLGQPFVLLSFAAFLRLCRGGRNRDLAEFVAAAVAVYLCHIYALSALMACLGCAGLLRLLRADQDAPSTPRPPRLPLRAVLAALCAAALFALAVYLVFFQHGTAANRGALGFDLSPRKAAHLLIDPLDSPLLGAPLRLIFLLCVLAVLALSLLAQKGSPARLLTRFGNPLVLAPALALLFLAYAGPAFIRNPDGSIKEAEIATRFTLSGSLLLFAALRAPAPPRLRAALVAVLTLLAVVKLGDAVRVHRVADQRLRALSALLAQIPPNQRVLPLMDLPGAQMPDYLYHRAGAYVVVERHGYSPHVFAVLGQHALRHRRGGDYRQVDDLVVTPDEWAYYDYLLIQTDATSAQPTIPGLAARALPVAHAAGFALYRSRR